MVSENCRNKMLKKESEQILNNQLHLWIKKIPNLPGTNLDKIKSFFK